MEILGWIATAAFAMCFWPQLYKSWKTKSVGDISVWSWVIQTIGYGTGLSYGIWLKQGPLIFGYIHGFLCSVVFIILYLKFRKN